MLAQRARRGRHSRGAVCGGLQHPVVAASGGPPGADGGLFTPGSGCAHRAIAVEQFADWSLWSATGKVNRPESEFCRADYIAYSLSKVWLDSDEVMI